MKPPLFSCLESRIANNGSLYGRFLLGPLPIDLSLTVATVLRRSLLHNVSAFTIVSAEIEGAYHEYASLPGIQESILEILLNLGEVPLTFSQRNFLSDNFRTSVERPPYYFASINIAGPAIITAKDIHWPKGIFCVKPDAYIATLSSNERFHMRLKIELSPFFLQKMKNEGKRFGSGSIGSTNLLDQLYESKTQENQEKKAPFSLNLSSSTSYLKNTKEKTFEKVPHKTNQKENSSASLSNFLVESSEISSPISSFIQIENYSPLSSYCLRKRRLLDQEKNLIESSKKYNSTEKDTLASSGFENNQEHKSSPTFQAFPKKGLDSLPSSNNTEPKVKIENFDTNKESIKGRNLPLKKSSPLLVKSSSYPVEKVNFLIERDDELAGYRHRIILEVWTNGSISPRQAIFDSVESLIKLIYSFREPVRNIFSSPLLS